MLLSVAKTKSLTLVLFKNMKMYLFIKYELTFMRVLMFYLNFPFFLNIFFCHNYNENIRDYLEENPAIFVLIWVLNKVIVYVRMHVPLKLENYVPYNINWCSCKEIINASIFS